MGRYVGTKILHLAVVLLIVSLLTYALLDLMPGGIEYSLFGPDAKNRVRDYVQRVIRKREKRSPQSH